MVKAILGVIAAVGAFFTLEYWKRRANTAEVKGITEKAAIQDTVDTKKVEGANADLEKSIETARSDIAALNDPNLKQL